LGERTRNGLYRPFYLVQSFATGAVLYAFCRKLPDRDLNELHGPVRAVMQAGRIAALLWAVWSAKEVGIAEILGMKPALQLASGRAEVEPEPEAQGPSMSGEHMNASGQFSLSRHHLNFAPLPVFWLRPKMTRNLLAFNVLATAYLALGSVHEASRLRKAYGRSYEDYERSGIPFFIPRPPLQPATSRVRRAA
jgi:hypothetical protein